ncbi:MAG: acyltransferase [Muribaculaceae bacterium]|nr:acyltransferase [Muribaculaceae bacterium]
MRQSNIEILRIISMLLVCLLHANFSALGIPDIIPNNTFSISDFARLEYESIALVSVNVFVLISGYFSIQINLKRIISLCFTILFWNVVLSAIAVFGGLVSFAHALKLLIPGLNDWFVQCYLLLVLVSPLCNSFIYRANQNQLRLYIFVFFIIEFIFGWIIFWGYAYDSGYSVLHFIGMYLLGHYIRLSDVVKLRSARRMLLYFIILVSSTAAFIYISLSWTDSEYVREFLIQRFTAYTSPINVLGAILLFIIALKVNFQSQIINTVARSAFSVYLIHTFPPIFVLYKKLAVDLFAFDEMLWPIMSLLFVSVVFIVCAILDQIRIFVLGIVRENIKSRMPVALSDM